MLVKYLNEKCLMDIYVALCKDLLVLRTHNDIYIEDIRVHD